MNTKLVITAVAVLVILGAGYWYWQSSAQLQPQVANSVTPRTFVLNENVTLTPGKMATAEALLATRLNGGVTFWINELTATTADVTVRMYNCTGAVDCAVNWPTQSAKLMVGSSTKFNGYKITLDSLNSTSATFSVSEY